MSKRSYRNHSVVRIPCEFLNGTVKAYLVKIQDKEIFLPRQLVSKHEDAVFVPLWLAKKEGLA